MTSFIRDASHADLFKDVVFLVESGHAEYMSHWIDYSHESPRSMSKDHCVRWEQQNPGKSVQIGMLDHRPIVVSIMYANLNGKRVAFYEESQPIGRSQDDRPIGCDSGPRKRFAGIAARAGRTRMLRISTTACGRFWR